MKQTVASSSCQASTQRQAEAPSERERSAAVELLAPKRVPLNTKAAKKKGTARIGAAVLSDDDDDLMQPPHDDSTVDERKEDVTQQPSNAQVGGGEAS